MNTETKIEYIKDICALVNGELRTDYSGRGMFGKKCIGIVTKYPDDAIAEAKTMCLPTPKVDNMALEFIVYWPQISTN